MSIIERERVTLKKNEDVPRMRHLVWTYLIDLGDRSTALCGYKLPVIEDFDLDADLGPAESADCIVCWEIFSHQGRT